MPSISNVNDLRVVQFMHEDLTSGTTNSVARDFTNQGGFANGLTFIFAVDGSNALVTAIVEYKNESGGNFAAVPSEGLIIPAGTLDIASPGVANGENLLKVGVIGPYGPFFRVGFTTTATTGTFYAASITGSDVLPANATLT